MLRDRISLAASYLRRSARTDAYPAVVGIEPTNNCNLDCVMCPRQEMTRQIGDMNTELFERIIDDLKGKTEFVWLQDYGEPFLASNIFDLIQAAKARGLRTGISSNGTVMTDKIIRNTLDSGLDYLIFAFDGATKHTYEKIRVGADFDRVTQNIHRFLDFKKRTRSKIYIVIQCICMEQTRDEIHQFIKTWRIEGVDGIRIRQLTYSGREGQFRNDPGRRPCYWLWSNPHIKQDGTVVPCCQDVNGKLALGNIKNASLGELWNGKKMQQLRQMHIEGQQGEIPLCKECNMYQPKAALVFGSAFLPYFTVNKWVPKVETLLSLRRYSPPRAQPDRVPQVT